MSRSSAGSLALAEDGCGLRVDSELDNSVTYIRDLIANLSNGNVSGMSFGFKVPTGGDTWVTEDVYDPTAGELVRVEVRTLHRVDLIEVSAVTFPAYEATDAALNSLDAMAGV